MRAAIAAFLGDGRLRLIRTASVIIFNW